MWQKDKPTTYPDTCIILSGDRNLTITTTRGVTEADCKASASEIFRIEQPEYNMSDFVYTQTKTDYDWACPDTLRNKSNERECGKCATPALFGKDALFEQHLLSVDAVLARACSWGTDQYEDPTCQFATYHHSNPLIEITVRKDMPTEQHCHNVA